MRKAIGSFVAAAVMAFPVLAFISSTASWGWLPLWVLTTTYCPARAFSYTISRMDRQTRLAFSTLNTSPFRIRVMNDDDGFTAFDEEDDDADDAKVDALLAYLPRSGRALPPLTKNVIKQATEKYVLGASNNVLGLLLEMLHDEYVSIDEPMTIGNVTVDVRTSGEQVDESFVEILSFAALHRLPKEIALELLGPFSNTTSDSVRQCQSAFDEHGWAATSFPNGLAVQLKRKLVKDASQKEPRALMGRTKKRAEFARTAVRGAEAAVAPKQRRQTRAEFLAVMDQQFGPPTSTAGRSKEELLFFPNSTPLPRFSLKRLKREADKQYAMLKTKGQAGFISYCFFNFVYYTMGVLWQWQKVAPADPMSSSSVVAVCLRKVGRVFGSLYLTSQLFKLPKLFASVALTPIWEKFLSFTQRRLKLSETVSTLLIVAVMYFSWMGIVSIPIVAEYAQLRRLVYWERLIDSTSI